MEKDKKQVRAELLFRFTQIISLRTELFFFWRVRKIEKGDYQLRHVRLSVRPHGTTRLPLEGF